jgi:hypothetical protein
MGEMAPFCLKLGSQCEDHAPVFAWEFKQHKTRRYLETVSKRHGHMSKVQGRLSNRLQMTVREAASRHRGHPGSLAPDKCISVAQGYLGA